MSTPDSFGTSPLRSRGISLIELIMFIVIVSIGLAALLTVFSLTTRRSADPALQKQAMAIAQSLMEEVQAKPFTYCDPDDANATTATSAAGCATLPEAMGPEGETRSGATPFDNVNDYGPSTTINPITDILGSGLAGLAGTYSATITVAAAALGTVPNTDALQITVTVTAPGNNTVSLQGHRTRYAPNAVP